MQFEIQRFADSGFLKDNLRGFVPQQISYDIIGQVTHGSTVMSLSKVEMMESDSKRFSVFKNGVGAYWVEESARIGTSVPQWEHPEIFAKKLGVIIPTTREKLDDTVVDVFKTVQPQIVEAFYKAIDEACLFGTNSPFTQNIYDVAMANGNAVVLGTNNKLDLDISDVMSLIETNGYDVEGFISNIAFKNQLRKLRDANGNQLYVQGINDGKNVYDTLYSLPITFNRNNAWDATKAICIAGNWAYSIIGVRAQIEYEILKEATLTSVTMADGALLNLAERDMIAVRATMRLGFLPVKGDAFAVLVPAGTTIPAPDSGSTETGSGTSSTETGGGTETGSGTTP